jgi:hypothetical protein
MKGRSLSYFHTVIAKLLEGERRENTDDAVNYGVQTGMNDSKS